MVVIMAGKVPYRSVTIKFDSLEQKFQWKELIARLSAKLKQKADMKSRLIDFIRLDLAYFAFSGKIIPLDLPYWVEYVSVPSSPITGWVALFDLEVLSDRSKIPLERIQAIANGDLPDCGELSKLFSIGLSPEKTKLFLGQEDHDHQRIEC